MLSQSYIIVHRTGFVCLAGTGSPGALSSALTVPSILSHTGAGPAWVLRLSPSANSRAFCDMIASALCRSQACSACKQHKLSMHCIRGQYQLLHQLFNAQGTSNAAVAGNCSGWPVLHACCKPGNHPTIQYGTGAMHCTQYTSG